ncbi:MAG: glycine zipper 2TM domain-containing protein [Caldimicrobium sp.]
MKKAQKLVALLVVFIFTIGLMAGCSQDLNLSQKTKEGATVGAVAGGVLGVLLDKNNRWRGAVLGAAIGAVIGGTASYIMDRASKEAATSKKPVTYESEDRLQKVYAQPLKTEGNCEWVKVQYYEYGKLVKEETKKVCY